MKRLTNILIALFLFSGLQSQILFNDVDVTAMLLECQDGGELSSRMADCTDKKLIELITSQLSEDCLPFYNKEERISVSYSITLDINSKGKLKSFKIFNRTRPNCSEALQKILSTSMKSLRFVPATKNGKPVDSKKRIVINHDWDKEDITYAEGVSESEEIFKVVEQMPRFPGCAERILSQSEAHTCAQQELLNYIYRNLSYPKEAKRAGVEGNVVVSFIVNKTGQISDLEIVRDLSLGCGEAALDVLRKMQSDQIEWEPGRQRGQAVNVRYILPVKFKLGK